MHGSVVLNSRENGPRHGGNNCVVFFFLLRLLGEGGDSQFVRVVPKRQDKKSEIRENYTVGH